MAIPSQFTSGLPTGQTQQAGAHITLPLSGTARNVFSKLDDVGAYASMERHEGESLVNFRARVQQGNIRTPGPTTLGVTDGIATALGLGHQPLLTLTAAADLKVDVIGHTIYVSGAGQYDSVDIVTQDPDGYWMFPDVHAVASGLNDIANLSASVAANASGLPAMLLEEQSSYIKVIGEQVPLVQQFTLGEQDGISLTGRKVITDRVGFTDEVTYAKQVAGQPTREGEWSVTTAGLVTSFHQPTSVTFVGYTYNLLPSGATMNLLGNGVKVFNMADPGLQQLLFTPSGVGGTAKDVLNEVSSWDKNFWGK